MNESYNTRIRAENELEKYSEKLEDENNELLKKIDKLKFDLRMSDEERSSLK